jgi:hypothetical protein
MEKFFHSFALAVYNCHSCIAVVIAVYIISFMSICVSVHKYYIITLFLLYNVIIFLYMVTLIKLRRLPLLNPAKMYVMQYIMRIDI